MRRRKKRSRWATRYNDRLPQSALEGQEYAEGQVPGPRDGPRDDSASNIDGNERPLWNHEEDESYYGRRNRDRMAARASAAEDDGTTRPTLTKQMRLRPHLLPRNTTSSPLVAGRRRRTAGHSVRMRGWACSPTKEIVRPGSGRRRVVV
jgi:hypothetical protein